MSDYRKVLGELETLLSDNRDEIHRLEEKNSDLDGEVETLEAEISDHEFALSESRVDLQSCVELMSFRCSKCRMDLEVNKVFRDGGLEISISPCECTSESGDE